MRMKGIWVVSAAVAAGSLEHRGKLELLRHATRNFDLAALEYQKVIKDALDFYEEITGEKVDDMCPKLKPCENAKVIDIELKEKRFQEFFRRINVPEPEIKLELTIGKLETLWRVHKEYSEESGKEWKSFEEIAASCLSDKDIEYYIGHYLYLMEKMRSEKPSKKTLEYLMNAKDYNPIPPRGSGEKFHPLKVLGHVLCDLNDRRCLFYYKKSIEYNEYTEDIEYMGVLDNIIQIIETCVQG